MLPIATAFQSSSCNIVYGEVTEVVVNWNVLDLFNLSWPQSQFTRQRPYQNFST